MALYHERWEHEVTYLALRHALLQGRVLRSGDPAGIEQETWALLAVYQALRIAVTDAVQTVPGSDPDRAGWQAASRWNKHPEGKPRTGHRITSITSNIDPGHYQPPTRRPKSVTNTEGP